MINAVFNKSSDIFGVFGRVASFLTNNKSMYGSFTDAVQNIATAQFEPLNKKDKQKDIKIIIEEALLRPDSIKNLMFSGMDAVSQEEREDIKIVFFAGINDVFDPRGHHDKPYLDQLFDQYKDVLKPYYDDDKSLFDEFAQEEATKKQETSTAFTM